MFGNMKMLSIIAVRIITIFLFPMNKSKLTVLESLRNLSSIHSLDVMIRSEYGIFNLLKSAKK